MSIYSIEILDNTLRPLTRITVFPVLNSATGTYLEFSKVLSSYGTCRFRVSTLDPVWKQYGNIFQPYQNHIRVKRDGVLAWQGIVINNPHRVHQYIEIEAMEYEFLFTKHLINHDSTGTADDSGNQDYRTLNAGTVGFYVQQFLTELKGKAGSGSPLQLLQIGKIENPLFPEGYVDLNNNSIAGKPWTFSSNFQLQFDFRDYQYVLQALALYAEFDYELIESFDQNQNTILTFNFQQYIGNKNTGLVFEYGPHGAIENYDSPLNGSGLVNTLTGLCGDSAGTNTISILGLPAPNSIKQFGALEGVAAFADVKSLNTLRTRLLEELYVVSIPDQELKVQLSSDKAAPIGQYNLGDSATFIINDHYIQFNQVRRITGIDVQVNMEDKERVTLNTTLPRDTQI
jgi:hypothetical protein